MESPNTEKFASILAQVLINLLGNALKFTNEGGLVVRCECVDSDAAERMVQFSVGDSGIGIPKDSLTKIFERFEQASSINPKP